MQLKKKLIILIGTATLAMAIVIIPCVATDADPVKRITLEVEKIEKDEKPAAVQEHEYIAIEEIPLDADLQEYMQGLCEENHLSFAFALMVMESESQYDPEAVGDEGRSIGYFQINQINWERMAEQYGYDVHKPRDNIASGIAILTELFEKYEDPYMVLLSYKCGESRGKDLFDQGIYTTVQFDCDELCRRAQEIERYME